MGVHEVGMRDPKLVIAIPAYNAALTVEGVFDRIPEEIVRRTSHFIVVDDGSADGTAEVARRLQARFPNLELLQHPANLGYGGAAKTGFTIPLGSYSAQFMRSTFLHCRQTDPNNDFTAPDQPPPCS